MTRLLKIVYLKPLGGYKTSLRSDTLWGLLCWGIRHLHGEKRLESFLNSYTEGSPEWIISSAFPYKQDGNRRVPFFPKPFLPDAPQDLSVSEKERLRLRKQVKKMVWLEQTDFEKTLKGDLKQADFLEQAKQEFPTDTTKVPPKEQRTVSMHNKIDRLRLSTYEAPDGGQLFQTENVFWEDPTNESDEKETTGLFFLAEVRNEESLALLNAVLRLYRHFGMGGNRTIGSGFFDAEIEDFTLTESASPNVLINLSLFHPTKTEIKALDAFDSEEGVFRYELEQRKGRTGFYPNFKEKQALSFFKEGSLLPLSAINLNGRFSGQLIKNFEKNYTYGYGFMVKMKI